MTKASRTVAYGIGFLAGFFLALTVFTILTNPVYGFNTNQYDAAIISILPFAVFSGAWVLTLRLLFEI
ncbi:MAG: hypothetical protein ACUVWK_07140 [Nitrososphaerales archaeon]